MSAVASLLLLLLAPEAPFLDATEAAGLTGVTGDRFAFSDFDRDGDADLLVGGQRLFRNEKGRFKEIPGALDGARGGSGCFADMDGDGRLDVVTLGGDLFLQRPDGSFRRVELEFPERQASFGIGDVDGDGRPDILTGGGEQWKDNASRFFPRRLLLNRGEGRFEDATERFGLESEQYGRSVVFADYDDDGDQDVYVGNYRLAPNELWVRDDGGKLLPVAEERGCRGLAHVYEGSGPYFGHTIGVSWLDLDDDGWLDLWVSNLVHKYVGPVDHPAFPGGHDMRGEICDDSNLYRNLGAPSFAFEDRRGDSGIPLMPKGGRGTFRGDELWSNCAAADYDNDGDLDVYVAQVYQLPYSYAHLYRNEGGFAFADADPGFRVFNSYGGAWADVDSDGRPDLVTGGNLGDPKGERTVKLWRNVTEPGRWIAFRLDPPVPGATLRVVTKTRVLTRQTEATMGSHVQQNSDLLHVGLGEDEVVEVRIVWPDGAGQLVTPLPKEGKLHVVERREWKRAPGIRVERDGTELVCRPKVAGARYHWDFDGDFRTDAETADPHVTPPGEVTAGVATLRVVRGGLFLRARLAE